MQQLGRCFLQRVCLALFGVDNRFCRAMGKAVEGGVLLLDVTEETLLRVLKEKSCRILGGPS